MDREASYPLDLLRAELARALAELQVQLMDRFASKNELADVRADVFILEKQTNGRFTAIDGKLDQLLTDKSSREGGATERDRWAHRWEVWAALALGLFTALLGAAGTLLAVYVGH